MMKGATEAAKVRTSKAASVVLTPRTGAPSNEGEMRGEVAAVVAGLRGEGLGMLTLPLGGGGGIAAAGGGGGEKEGPAGLESFNLGAESPEGGGGGMSLMFSDL